MKLLYCTDIFQSWNSHKLKLEQGLPRGEELLKKYYKKFVDLKSNWALKSHKGYNLLKRV